MTRARLDGLYLLLIGTLLFLILGIAFEKSSPHAMQDFRVLYNPARCLIQSCDPYKQSDVLRLYAEEGSGLPSSQMIQEIVTRYIYPPTTFLLTVPLAILTWGPAHISWMILTLGGLVLASLLVWDLGADYAPVLSAVLVGFLLANCESIAISGNSAGIVVSLCVIAVWCFLREKYLLVGILSLSISLAMKPHDSGLIWLFFILAGGAYRKRAIQTLMATVCLSLPPILWVWHVSPHWIEELNANIAAFSVRGGLNDPSPAAAVINGPGMLTNLQAVFSFFWDDPRKYNFATYFLCIPMLAIWIACALRTRSSHVRVRLALATIAALSLLPVYHRQYDAKLLLLTIPACTMLWAEGGILKWIAVLLTFTGILINGDLSQAVLIEATNRSHAFSGATDQLRATMQAFPAPIIILLMTVFYLWVLVLHHPRDAVVSHTEGSP